MQSKGFGVLLLTFATFFGQLFRHPAINNKLEVCPSLTIVTFQFPSLLHEQQKISCCCAEKLSTWIDDNRCTKNFTYGVRNSISIRISFFAIFFFCRTGQGIWAPLVSNLNKLNAWGLLLRLCAWGVMQSMHIFFCVRICEFAKFDAPHM